MAGNSWLGTPTAWLPASPIRSTSDPGRILPTVANPAFSSAALCSNLILLCRNPSTRSLRSGLTRKVIWDSHPRRLHPYLNPNSGHRKHRNQSIDREHPNLASHQVGDARLRDGKEHCRFGLVEALGLDMLTNRHHQRGSMLHVRCLGGIVFDRIPYALECLIAHRFCSFTSSEYRLLARARSLFAVR